ncbi:MAG: excinuclease ABC subunit UvrA [Clostridiales bacterium]|nr:excinuclease ABC subunit UvrA [Clostridiales bacterium]
MSLDKIVIKGAKENNLKNIDLEIPRDKFVVFTGLSGSGKSSLAFDTIYAEGQRRYIESLSSYARMFLGQMEKPNVEMIEGLSPAISIDQKTTSKNPRSTVGTVTEIYDYLRLLYARIGIPHCPICGREIKTQTVDQVVDSVLSLDQGSKIQILAPIARNKKGEFTRELSAALKAGFVRARIDGETTEISDDIKLPKTYKHNIEIIVDRLVVKEDIRSRLAESIETATAYSKGLVYIDVIGGKEQHYSLKYSCPEHDISIDELTPRMFSFNNPLGACPKCTGLGIDYKVSPNLIMPNKNLSISEGGICGSGWSKADAGTVAEMYYKALGKKYGFTLKTPLKDISEDGINALLYGTTEKLSMSRPTLYGSGKYNAPFEGIVNNLERRYAQSTSDWSRWEIEQVMEKLDCPECHGSRLKKEYLSVTVGGINIKEFCDMSVDKALNFIDSLKLNKRERLISETIIKEIHSRLYFLKSVGLEYLTLSRSSGTLSGGESQRIRLATQIGSSLMGVVYILDEPSIGLHQKDNDKLIETLKHLRDLGNTLIVVEHDEETIRESDFVVDIGPGAGIHGGEVIYTGDCKGLIKCKESITGQYLSGKRCIPVPEKRRKGNGHSITIKDAYENNLKHIDVKFPLGTFNCVTGVSGSGKSTLINDILYRYLANELNGAKKPQGKFDTVEGIEHLDKVISIDQSPIGRTPRSNPATYTGTFTDIRNLFASTQDSKVKGYTASRYSFNVKGGRCEACEGDGIKKIEMHFLADVYVPCEVCKGKRYNRETLEVKYKGKNIYNVLDMTVDEALEFFGNQPKIKNKLQTLADVGLGYLKLGQSATTLSGGEAQRVKLATELSKRSTGNTIYILDEPTTGLHTADVHKLIDVLQRLVNAGNTVIVIEHNLDIIKTADYIVDLGPDGGDNGGTVVASGTPEQIAKIKKSYTGQYLQKIL